MFLAGGYRHRERSDCAPWRKYRENILCSCLRAALKTGYALRWLRCAVPEILMYAVYAPVCAIQPPCTRSAHDTFQRCHYAENRCPVHSEMYSGIKSHDVCRRGISCFETKVTFFHEKRRKDKRTSRECYHFYHV